MREFITGNKKIAKILNKFHVYILMEDSKMAPRDTGELRVQCELRKKRNKN